MSVRTLTLLARYFISVSIHVPRAGYDRRACSFPPSCVYFYPRTPCGVRRQSIDLISDDGTFLSTYPVRGTTMDMYGERLDRSHFYPRTPCGVRRKHYARKRLRRYFYPRTPCGVRLLQAVRERMQRDFYPRTPCGVRPALALIPRHSAHHFYPRTPCGVRQIEKHLLERRTSFLSTYPVRGTTYYHGHIHVSMNISIHVPRAGYDSQSFTADSRSGAFLSTYPVRGTTP